MALYRRLLGFCAAALVPVLACGRVSGISDYDNVDCVRDCGIAVDGAPQPSRDAANEMVTPVPEAAAVDTGPPPFDAGTPCPTGQARVVLTVSGAQDTVSSNPNGVFNVRSGDPTASVCFAIGQTLRLELANLSGDWQPAQTCKDPNPTGRCEFVVPSAGLTIAVTVQ